MIEIAISLAIIGFAMIAIIGVLPIGMNAQKDNREETIINQEATMFMDAIRNGARGLDDLTNYVMAITNRMTYYNADGTIGQTNVYGYTYYASTVNEVPLNPPFPITNGLRIVGLLSTPKYLLPPGGSWGGTDFASNYVVAYVRSMSGPASEKFPQTNDAIHELGFSYRLTSEVVPCWTNSFDRSWVDFNEPGLSPYEIAVRSNRWAVAKNVQANLHDVRLLFRWPLRSQGQLGPGGQTFRTLVGGKLLATQETNYPALQEYTLYFFEPRNYTNRNLQTP